MRRVILRSRILLAGRSFPTNRMESGAVLIASLRVREFENSHDETGQ